MEMHTFKTPNICIHALGTTLIIKYVYCALHHLRSLSHHLVGIDYCTVCLCKCYAPPYHHHTFSFTFLALTYYHHHTLPFTFGTHLLPWLLDNLASNQISKSSHCLWYSRSCLGTSYQISKSSHCLWYPWTCLAQV